MNCIIGKDDFELSLTDGGLRVSLVAPGEVTSDSEVALTFTPAAAPKLAATAISLGCVSLVDVIKDSAVLREFSTHENVKLDLDDLRSLYLSTAAGLTSVLKTLGKTTYGQIGQPGQPVH